MRNLIKLSMYILIILLFYSLVQAELVKIEVKKGDTLHRFAQKYLKDPTKWPKIFDINKSIIKDPNRIYPNQIILIPMEMLKEKVGDLVVLQNFVQIKKREGGNWKKAVKRERLFPEDGILTGEKSFAKVDFLVGSNLKVYENSLIYLKPTQKKTAVASLLEGGLQVKEIRIITPSAEIIPKGAAEYEVDIDAKKTTKISVNDGEVNVKALGETVTVAEGFRTIVKFNSTPELPKLLPQHADDILASDEKTEINFRLEISRKNDFEILVKNEITSDITVENIKKDLEPGEYLWRVAVVDSDGFKGKYSQSRNISVTPKTVAFVELNGFEILNKEERILRISGITRNTKSVVINGYPAISNESGEFQTIIILAEGQDSITLTAISSEGVILRKYRRTPKGTWLPLD